MLQWQPEPPRRRRIRGEHQGLVLRNGAPSMHQHRVPVAVECHSAEDDLPLLQPPSVAVSPRNEAKPLGLQQRQTYVRSQDGGAGGVPSATVSAACDDVIVAEEQTPAFSDEHPASSSSGHHSDEASMAFPEIKKCQEVLMTHLDCFVSDVIARLERLERPAAVSNGKRTTLSTIKESEEPVDGFGLMDGIISREVTRQLAVMGDMLRREVSTASQVALGNSSERLQGTLKAEIAENAAVSEAVLIEAKATMAASVERLRETLQQEVGILHVNLQSAESRIKLLERRSEQALQGPTSQALLQQSPRSVAEAVVEPPRLISAPQSCRPALVSSRGVAPSAGSPVTPRPVTLPTNRSRLPRERQTLDRLQRRLAGKVSGIVSVLNQSCETRSCQNGSWNGTSSPDSGHGCRFLPNVTLTSQA